MVKEAIIPQVASKPLVAEMLATCGVKVINKLGFCAYMLFDNIG